MSVGINTKLYGFYKPWKKLFGDKIQMIRHVATPSVSFSAAPDFGRSRMDIIRQYNIRMRRAKSILRSILLMMERLYMESR